MSVADLLYQQVENKIIFVSSQYFIFSYVSKYFKPAFEQPKFYSSAVCLAFLSQDKLMKHEKLMAIASKYPGKTSAQILLAWALQQGMGK